MSQVAVLYSERILKYARYMSPAPAQASRFRSSELSRNSAKVFAAAEESPVIVTRRDAEPLVLMTEQEADAREQLFDLAAQLVAVATDTKGTLAERMADHLPWMLALAPEDRRQCAEDLLRAARASFSTGQAQLAVAELTSWRETAAAVAAGLGAETTEWLDEDVPVTRP